MSRAMVVVLLSFLIMTNVITTLFLIQERKKTTKLENKEHLTCTCPKCVDAYWMAFMIAHPEFNMPLPEDHIPHPTPELRELYDYPDDK